MPLTTPPTLEIPLYARDPATGTTYAVKAAAAPTALNDLVDADTFTTPPVAGDALVFDGANWVPVTPVPPPPTTQVALVLEWVTGEAWCRYNATTVTVFGHLSAPGAMNNNVNWDIAQIPAEVSFPVPSPNIRPATNCQAMNGDTVKASIDIFVDGTAVIMWNYSDLVQYDNFYFALTWAR